MWKPPSNDGSTPVSLKSGESPRLNSPLTPLSPSIVPAMPGAESTPILYSRVISPTIPPVETSSAPLNIVSFMSSMGNCGSDDLLSSAQPSMGNHGSGVLPSGMQSPVLDDGSDGQLAVFHNSFDGLTEEWEINPNPWTRVEYGRRCSHSPTSSVVAQYSQQSIQSKSTVTRVRNEFFPEVGGIDIQGTPITAANAALTAEQQESIHRQAEIVDVVSDGQ